MKVMIFGAKSLALGACRALQALYGEHLVGGFLVTSLEDNAEVLNGLPVMEISKFADSMTDDQRQEICVFIGTPEDVHPAIVESVRSYGFGNNGFYHYRRVLDISEDDLRRMKHNDIDVILQYPTIHEPDIKEHHARYMKEKDWDTMLHVVGEVHPEYRAAYEDIFSREYFYNYNLIIAKRDVLREYCEWLFPILERTGQLSEPKEWERADRYLAYMSESLVTLYFFHNKDKLKIYHTGRVMLI